jgi:hypothetical protein
MLNRVLKNNFRGVYCLQARNFRQTFVNPYKSDPTPMSDALREAQTAKPVWDRVFDH